MLTYLLELLLMVSLGLIMYLVARALPRISDVDTASARQTPVPGWVAAYFERFDERVLAVLEKLIRRIRLWILKFDNSLLSKLERFRRPTSGKPPLGLDASESPKEGSDNNSDSPKS